MISYRSRFSDQIQYFEIPRPFPPLKRVPPPCRQYRSHTSCFRSVSSRIFQYFPVFSSIFGTFNLRNTLVMMLPRDRNATRFITVALMCIFRIFPYFPVFSGFISVSAVSTESHRFKLCVHLYDRYCIRAASSLPVLSVLGLY